jgi:LysR family transcriptional regulator (chromosome initiation inhibitor)
MRPTLVQLRALSTTVAEGTLEAAARALNLTPSAVSQRLRALESVTGQVLLVRSKPVRGADGCRVRRRTCVQSGR